MRRRTSENHAFPPVLFVHQGTAADAAPVFDEFWPAARAVADERLLLYRAFGVGRGRLGQLFSPAVVGRALAARRRGYRQGKTVGDPWLMPAAFLVDPGRVIRTLPYRHVGDEPDIDAAVASADPARR